MIYYGEGNFFDLRTSVKMGKREKSILNFFG